MENLENKLDALLELVKANQEVAERRYQEIQSRHNFVTDKLAKVFNRLNYLEEKLFGEVPAQAFDKMEVSESQETPNDPATTPVSVDNYTRQEDEPIGEDRLEYATPAQVIQHLNLPEKGRRRLTMTGGGQLPRTSAKKSDTFDDLTDDDDDDENVELDFPGNLADKLAGLRAKATPKTGDKMHDKVRDSAASILFRSLKSSEEHAVKVVMQSKPPEVNFKLKYLTLKSVSSFLEEATGYQTQNRIQIELGRYIDFDILKRMAVKFKKAVFEVRAWPNYHLACALLELIKPEDVGSFVRKLSANVTVPWSDKDIPTPYSFPRFATALMQYREDFIHSYELLSQALTDTELKLIPPCTNKEGGLIHIFLSKVPFGYGKQIHLELDSKVKKLEKSNMMNVYKYMTLFYEMVKADEAALRVAATVLRRFGGTYVEAVRAAAAKQGAGARLFLINQETGEESTEEGPEYSFFDDEEEPRQEDDRSSRDPNLHSDTIRKDPDSSNLDKKNMACYAMLASGVCPNGDLCPYSHDMDVIREVACKLKSRVDQLVSGNGSNSTH